MEDLNKGDIQANVHDHLAGDADFREMSSYYPSLEDSIRNGITRKASGVFLWVYLVVRDLLKVVRDGGSESLLRRTLADTPSELDIYFMRMLGSIDLKYRKEASILRQIMSCSLERLRLRSLRHFMRDPDRAGDLLIIHLWHLEKEHLQTFATNGTLPRLQPVSERDLGYKLKMLDRRLASHGMGLLEWEHTDGDTEPQWYSPIVFFHRTVHDFLLTPPAQQILHKETNGAFRAHEFRCNLILSEIFAAKWLAQMTNSPRQIAQAKSLRKYFTVYTKLSKDIGIPGIGQSQLPYMLQLSRTKVLLAQLRRLDREIACRIVERLIGYLDPRDIGWQTLKITELDKESCRIATLCRDSQELDSTTLSAALMEFRGTLVIKAPV